MLETNSTLEYLERLYYILLAFLEDWEICIILWESCRLVENLMESIPRSLGLTRINLGRGSKSVLYTLPGISISTHGMKLQFVPFILLVKKWRSMMSFSRSCDWCLIFKFQNESQWMSRSHRGVWFWPKNVLQKILMTGQKLQPSTSKWF